MGGEGGGTVVWHQAGGFYCFVGGGDPSNSKQSNKKHQRGTCQMEVKLEVKVKIGQNVKWNSLTQ